MRGRFRGVQYLVFLLAIMSLLAVGLIGCNSDSDSLTEPGDDVSAEQPIGGKVDPLSLRYIDEQECLRCHGDPKLEKKFADGTSISLFVDTGELPYAVHRFLDCTTCHTDDPHAVETPLSKVSQAEKCGTCHEYQYTQHAASVHGVPLNGGGTDTATCADCHSEHGNPHDIVRVLDPLASTYPKNVARTCAKCHDDPDLMDKYGIVEKVYESYMSSFHGKAMELSPDNATILQLDTATCVNCHGVHNIKTVSDPTAPVAGMDNLLQTCQLCHPSAGPEFISSFLGHRAVSSDYFPVVYYGGTIFSIAVRVMLGFGILTVLISIGLRFGPWIAGKFKRR